jgi:hypothetical protein
MTVLKVCLTIGAAVSAVLVIGLIILSVTVQKTRAGVGVSER